MIDNGIITNGGGVFGISKHVYSWYRFANDLVAEEKPESWKGINLLSGIVMTREEVQVIIDQYVANPNENQLYVFYISYNDDSNVSLNSIFQCVVDIPSLYANNHIVGFAIKNYEQGKVADILNISSDDASSLSELIYKNGYSVDAFIGGLQVVFD